MLTRQLIAVTGHLISRWYERRKTVQVINLGKVTVVGYSSDGQWAYVVKTDGRRTFGLPIRVRAKEVK